MLLAEIHIPLERLTDMSQGRPFKIWLALNPFTPQLSDLRPQSAGNVARAGDEYDHHFRDIMREHHGGVHPHSYTHTGESMSDAEVIRDDQMIMVNDLRSF